MERRHFLWIAGGMAATGLGGGALLWRPWGRVERTPRQQGRVALVRDSRALLEQRQLHAGRVREMVRRALCAATGEEESKGAWQSLFSPDDIVGLKLNCLAGPLLSPHPLLVRALVEGLLSAGLKARQIIVWERSERELQRAGYTINRGEKKGPLVLATDTPGWGYRSDREKVYSYSGRFSRILEKTTAQISVGILKNHDLSGVGICLKNYFGAIDNPHEYHHDQCSPFIADVCASSYLGERLRLSVADALWGQCHGGPTYSAGWIWPFAGILASTDSVALDAVGAALIEQRRRAVGLPPLLPKAAQPRFLAAASRRGLGLHDLDRIQIIKG